MKLVNVSVHESTSHKSVVQGCMEHVLHGSVALIVHVHSSAHGQEMFHAQIKKIIVAAMVKVKA